MIEQDAPHRNYHIRMERIGPALAAGGAICGIVAAALLALGGGHDVGSLARAFVLGALFSTLALAAVGGPVWIVCHAIGWRGPVHAALAGALLGFLLFLFGQVEPVAASTAGSLYAWLRELGSSLILAAIAAAVTLLMWRIAYQRQE